MSAAPHSPIATPAATQIARLPNGIDLAWDERGEGPTVLLIMGIGAQMIYWPDGFCDAIAQEGFRVVRFDNRDVGESTYLSSAGVPPIGKTLAAAFLGTPLDAPYTLEDMADDTAMFLDEIGIDRAHVVGASMGGMIAQTMAFTHPHRVSTLTSIFSTTGERRLDVSAPRGLKALLGAVPRSREEAQDRTVELYSVIGSTGYPRDEAYIRERAGRAYDRGQNPRGFLRQFAAIAKSGDRTSRLRFVRAPTLVIHGTVDPLIRPIGGELTAKAIPGARLERITGMGHDLPEALWPRLTNLLVEHTARA